MIVIATNNDIPQLDENYTKQWLELSSMSNYFSNGSNSSSASVTMNDLLRYYQNPYDNITKIRKASKYFVNKHGILRDVHRMVRSLPTLKYSTMWSSYNEAERSTRTDKKVINFLDEIDVVKVVRDGLYSVAVNGTVVTCLRSKKYVQFLDLEDIVVKSMRNGKWVVEIDMQTIDKLPTKEKVAKINSLPDEITIGKYNAYLKDKRNDENRFVEISNCHVINLDADRSSWQGLPLSFGAWFSILQKEIIDNVERSVASRLIKQILILSASGISDKNGNQRPMPPEVIQAQFKNVSKLVQAKESKNHTNEESATGVIAFTDEFNLKALDIDTTLFKNDLYAKIKDDILSALGISDALLTGNSGNFASANVNSEKFMSFIFTIVEQFEKVINDYLKIIVPKKMDCKIRFERSTTLDKRNQLEDKRQIYMQMGIAQPYIEAVFGENSFQTMIEQAQFEKSLGLSDLFTPPLNAYTSSGKDKQESEGRPEEKEPNNDNTSKSKDNNGNSTPSPTD